ncbi:MAG: FtsQ-type protein [Glaciihabitans sp.]|nr:FtsQ-type protein [Glaciihabitans sp.]
MLAVAIYSPILALREITIDGTTRVSQQDVQAAVDSQLGTPLALLDFDKIRSELAAFPLIRSYVTETVPPNTLRIHIVEREPIAALVNGSSFDLVDPAGVVIASTTDRSGIPVLDAGADGITGTGFTSAVEVLLAMPDSVIARIDTITARTADDVGLTLRDSTLRVVWGSADDSELKAQDLERLLALPDCTALPVIDVSAPLAPICGPN